MYRRANSRPPPAPWSPVRICRAQLPWDTLDSRCTVESSSSEHLARGVSVAVFLLFIFCPSLFCPGRPKIYRHVRFLNGGILCRKSLRWPSRFCSFFIHQILLTPMKLIFKLLLNTGCRFICLFLLNPAVRHHRHCLRVEFHHRCHCGLSGPAGHCSAPGGAVLALRFPPVMRQRLRTVFPRGRCRMCGSRQGPMDQERSIG